jgi:hypothetical protein
MPQLPMLLPLLLRQICCCFHEPRAQPNLQPPEMQPDPQGCKVCKGKAILKKQKPHTIYFLPKFMFTQK